MPDGCSVIAGKTSQLESAVVENGVTPGWYVDVRARPTRDDLSLADSPWPSCGV